MTARSSGADVLVISNQRRHHLALLLRVRCRLRRATKTHRFSLVHDPPSPQAQARELIRGGGNDAFSWRPLYPQAGSETRQ